ncbi:MAG TPA: hypothetical protein VFC19_49210 [Candidatus Limnocylindrales bacterium]|nr:hypothetical protein [Candidatus Limnocylindrales bacterium]
MTALRRRIGRRGAALLFFAFLDIVYCLSLLTPTQAARDSAALRFAAAVAPLWAWAGLWGTVGVVCLFCAFLRRDQVGFTAAIAIKVMWGLLLVGAQLFGDVERGYVSAAVWLALALLVGLISGWPEPPRRAVL